jgi:hypothetical protein
MNICPSLWWLSSCRNDIGKGPQKSAEFYVDVCIQENVYTFKYSTLLLSVSNVLIPKYMSIREELNSYFRMKFAFKQIREHKNETLTLVIMAKLTIVYNQHLRQRTLWPNMICFR